MAPHIILDAKKATGKESLYLSAIGRRFQERADKAAQAARGLGVLSNGGAGSLRVQGNGRDGVSGRGGAATGGGIRDSGTDWDERVAKAWPVFCKYFNGRSALERIALQEDMKRKDVWNLLTSMSEYLLCVRHW
jgi:hypothetical protein